MNTDFYRDTLAALQAEGRLRRIPDCDAPAGAVDFTSNDYLGLAAEPGWARRFICAHADGHFSSSASRLLCTRGREHAALEALLDDAYGKRTLLFNSGYHANTGCVSALAPKGTLILADRLVHASIIDGIILSKAPFRRFRHNDPEDLRANLRKYAGDYERVLIVTESIFSMDGDVAPLREFAAIRREFTNALLYVDEAHALGVRGARGLGLCEELGILADVDLLIGTFGKACASCGAFAATSPQIREYLVNSARSFIFSTALPPLNIAFTRFLFAAIMGMEQRRERLQALSEHFRAGIERITGEPSVSRSQIVPLMAGSNQRAVAWSEQLRRQGVLALPIRRPTVPAGTERIRFSLNADLTDADVDRALSAIASLS